MCGIYSIKNLVNNKVYIGQAVNFKLREKRHFSLLKNNKHSNKHLQNSYNKYGLENFKFIIIENCNINLLSRREQYWINKNKGHLYNKNLNVLICDRNPFLGRKHTDEIKAQMSAMKKGLYEGNKNPNFGKKASLETKLKMVENSSNSKLNKDKVLEIKNLLEEGILLDSEIAKTYNVSRTVITRIANGTRWANITGGPVIKTERRGKRNIGKSFSDERKQKISFALKSYRERS